MPALEGLFPLRDENVIFDMLFECANFHALGKLRLHTEVTIKILEESTPLVYEAIKRFADETCPRYDTVEQQRDVVARLRRAKKKKTRSKPDGTRKTKVFNVINTYKYHALGHWASYIRRSGPLDVYSTQVVCHNHFHLGSRTNAVHTGRA